MAVFGDDWREWLSVMAFRVWRRVRRALKPATSPRLANIYTVISALLAAAAIPMIMLGWPALIVAVLCVYAAFWYALDAHVMRVAMRVAAGQDSKIHPRDFLYAPAAPDAGYRLVKPTDMSMAQLYPYVDLSDHSVFIQLENDLTRDQRIVLYQRWFELCPDAFMHLEKKSDDHWQPIAVSIMLPLSPTGFRAITSRDAAHRIRVIDLDQDGILRRPATRNPVLLIDTWIVDREGGHGGAGHGKSETRGGNANLLVLRHLAQFWNSANRFRQMIFLVETANPRLTPTLETLSFRPSGASGIGEAFYSTSSAQFDAIAAAEFAHIKTQVRSVQHVPVDVGTVPRPRDWYYS
ncbi:hypothetical protein [Nocardia sp. NPDC051570]|uniref:hypothetical protein n=1 Tax=Nocardia sp. NPDC051570 TaxID=3364324 RepID=UPI0037A45286